MKKPLEEKAMSLKQRIAQLRASRNPNNTHQKEIRDIVIKKIADITPPPEFTPPPVYTSPPQYIQELDESGEIINLAGKYGITQEVCITLWELMDATKSDEFEEKDFLEVLEKGKIISLSIRDFAYFKILKICATDWWNDIFVVNFKYKNSKPAKTTLILKFQFPLKPNNGIIIISPRNQQQLWNMHIIDGISINKKTFLEKTLERFWF